MKTLSWKEGTEDWVPLSALLPITPPPPPDIPSSPSSPPDIRYRSDVLGFLILGCCCAHAILIGVGVGFGVNEGGINAISLIIVLLAGGLVYFDAKAFGMGSQYDLTRRGVRRCGPVLWMFGVTGTLIAPVYLFRRRLYGARNLVVPSIFALLLSFLVVVAAASVDGESPPEVDKPEVVSLVRQIIQRQTGGMDFQVVSPKEVRYSSGDQRRIGQALMKTSAGEAVPFYYSVQWDRSKAGDVIVTVADRETDLR